MSAAARANGAGGPLSAKLWPFKPTPRAPVAMNSAVTTLAATLNFGPALDVAARSSASISKLLVPENQDNLLLIDAEGRAVFLHEQAEQLVQLADWPAGHVRLAVLDGMGGHGHGREAAEATVAGLLELPACRSLAVLACALDALHARLQARFSRPGDHDTLRRPGTTLTLLEFPPGQAPLLYHVGDSRLYEITASRVAPLTVDHVPATAFALHGLLKEGEWWQQVHAEHRSQITQAFILGNAFANPQQLEDALCPLGRHNLPPFLGQLGDRRALTLRPGARYLLASDGFWACQRPAEWVARWPALLGQPGLDAATALARLYDEFASHPPPGLHIDNVTAIVFQGNDCLAMDETALPSAPPA